MGFPHQPPHSQHLHGRVRLKPLVPLPSPFPLAKVCWWHLCHQQGRTQSGTSATHQQPGPSHTVYSGTNTTRLTPIPRHSSHHTTWQHIQHFSIQETNPHRPISTLGQQSPHHCQTKCIQHTSTQSQGSLLYTGPPRQGTPTYEVSITPVSISRLGSQPMASKVHQPQPTKQQQQPQQQQPTRQQQQKKEHHHSCAIHARNRGKILKSCAKGKEFKYTSKGPIH